MYFRTTKEEREDYLRNGLWDDFFRAAYGGDFGGVQYAIKSWGRDVNEPDSKTGMTALHMAAVTGNLALAQYLVEQCDAAFTFDFEGRTPRDIAFENATLNPRARALWNYLNDKEREQRVQHIMQYPAAYNM